MFELFNLEEQYANFPQIQREEVQKLLQWANAQPHLPKITEHEALCFFFACNCSMEYSKQVLDLSYTCRTHFDEFFGNLDVESPEMKQTYKTVAAFPMEQKTPEGNAVLLAKLIDTDPSHFNFVNSIKLYCISQDKIMLEKGLASGLIIAIDLTGVAFGHITRIGIMQLKKVIYYLQEAIPSRLVGLHFLNSSSIIDKILALMQPFMKKELMDMLHVHTTMETFYKSVPRELLPKEYGGPGLDMKQMSDKHVQSLFESRLDIMEYNSTHRVNEKLRPAKAKHTSDLFGTEGNFKKLDID
ncbi:alpha-tocopherol transfer protein-like [Haematobia irritans]|uniref:alpha-tocopherol transfer protein-like n=1 Tax=Haematobia irritans TaxID=7368 RepID=UPI003F4F418A